MADAPDVKVFEFSVRVPAKLEDLFRFHVDFRNVKRIMPPYPAIRILHAPPRLKENETFAVGLFFIPLIGIYWESRVVLFEENRRFSDIQVSPGPFKYWRHDHCFRLEGKECVLTDHIHYKLHFGILGKLFDFLIFRHALRLLFRYRSWRLRLLFRG